MTNEYVMRLLLSPFAPCWWVEYGCWHIFSLYTSVEPISANLHPRPWLSYDGQSAVVGCVFRACLKHTKFPNSHSSSFISLTLHSPPPPPFFVFIVYSLLDFFFFSRCRCCTCTLLHVFFFFQKIINKRRVVLSLLHVIMEGRMKRRKKQNVCESLAWYHLLASGIVSIVSFFFYSSPF